MVKIDIPVTNVKGKQKCTAQDGHGECRLKSNCEGDSSEGDSIAESWIVQVQQRYRSGEYEKRKTSSSVCIYRVPESIRNNETKGYDPLVVSLGPYHQKHRLSAMDDYKLQAVQLTLERLHGMTMDDLIKEVQNLEKDVRDCYEDSAIEWDGETLVWMLTMDACFILQFLRRGLPNSSLVHNNIKGEEIVLDILKLENQIPFCILEKILQLEFTDSEQLPMVLAKLLIKYRYFTGYPFSHTSAVKGIGLKEIEKLISKRSPGHLLDFCRVVISHFLTDSSRDSVPGSCACFRRPHWTDTLRFLFPSTPTDRDTIPSAEKLKRAGIECKPSPNGKVHFKHKSFGRRTLFVPQITIEHSTDTFLRNLMAFEECQRGRSPRMRIIVSLHVCLMDELIDSVEDVVVLEKQEIIRNYMGSDEYVGTLFNDVCRGITYGDGEVEKVVKMVNQHYNSQMNVWISQFIEERCSKPWYIVSFVAAVLLLGLTAVQTFFSVKK